MYVSFSRFSGPYELDDRQPTKASTALAVGSALKENTGLDLATSDSEIQGIALQAKSSAVAAQTPILILRLLSRTKVYGTAGSGTFVTNTDGNRSVDLSSAVDLAADTYTNGDFLVYQVLSTTQAVGVFTHLAWNAR